MKRAGEIIRPTPSDETPETVTPATLAKATTAQLDQAAADLKYLAREFVQCAFPYKNPGKIEEWRQDFHGLVFTIRRGRSDFGIPYGVVAKLGTIWICTEIVERPNADRYELGESLAEIMREVGYNAGAEKTSRRKQHMATLRDLFAANIAFTDKTGYQLFKSDVGQGYELWGSADIPQQGNLFPSWVRPTHEFKQHVLKSFVPVPLWAMRNHLHSPLELDLLFMLGHRNHMLNNRASLGGELFIPSTALKVQFGQNYERDRDFRREFSRALTNIQTKTWNRNQSGATRPADEDPEGDALRAEFTRQGLFLWTSTQLVKSKPGTDKVFARHRKTTKPAKLAQAKAIMDARKFDHETLERAKLHLGGLSVEKAEQAFWAWLQAQEIDAHDPRPLFFQFCLTHRKRNRA